jgi:ParB-like chromosome segregation protein Spo0J
MTVESLALADLAADPANARVHSPRNLDAIKASLQRFGQQKPIVVDSKGVVRAGNGTLAAAKALGWTHIQAIRTDLISSEATAYAIADNRTSDLSEWDDEALARQLDSLRSEGIDMHDIGFTDREVAKMLDDPLAPGDSPGVNDLTEQWLVIVTCKDESDQAAFLQQMETQGRQCRAVVG